MGERKVQILFGIIIVISLIGLLFLANIGADKLKKSLMDSYGSSKAEKIENLTKETEKKHKDYIKVMDKTKKESVNETVKKELEKEKVIALQMQPIVPNIFIRSGGGEEILYVFDRVMDMTEDSQRYLLSTESQGKVINPITDEFLEVFIADDTNNPEAFYKYNNKLYIYKLGDQKKIQSPEEYESLMKENEEFQKELLSKYNINQ